MQQLFRFSMICLILTQLVNFSGAYTPSATDWRDQVFYFLMVDRFQDGDATNNSLNGTYNPSSGTGIHGGDIKGITQKLDYIKGMGITALWISPVPKNDGDYHGYGAVDWYQVDPRLGTMADLKELVAQAHARGMYVFLDIVCNHMGGRIKTSTGSTSWNYPTGYSLEWHDINKKYNPAPFDNVSSFHNYGNMSDFGNQTQLEKGSLFGLNDMKTEDPTVRDSLITIYQWWIAETDCDGFRIDTIKHVDMAFWQSFCGAIRSYAATLGKNDFLMYGEVWDGDYKCGQYTGTKAGGAYALKSVLYYPMYYTSNNVFAWDHATNEIDNTYAQLYNYDTTTWDYLATFIDNHDNPRFLSNSHAANDWNKLKLAMTFMLTSKGIPIIYYGTEQGFNGESDPANREDMFDGQYESGPSLGDNFNTSFSLYQFSSTLIDIRKTYAPLRRGTHVSRWTNTSGPGIYAFSRIYNNEEIIVLLNTANSVQTTKSGSTGVMTTFPQYTLLKNVLNPTEIVEVGANGVGVNQISVVLPARSEKILVVYSLSTVKPQVSSTVPTNNQTSVPLNQTMLIQFTLPMNTTSVQQAITMNPSISGSFSWNDLNLYFSPAVPWTPNQLYTVTVNTTAVTSSISNPQSLESTYIFSFRSRLNDDLNPPLISNVSPANGSLVTSTLKPTLQAYLSDTQSGLNPSTIKMSFDSTSVGYIYASASGLITYTPLTTLSIGTHFFVISVEDNCTNLATMTSRFQIQISKIMDGNFVNGEWNSAELRSSNTYNPWGSNDIKQLYISADSIYLYIAVIGAVDILGYTNLVGVYVDVPTITTGLDNKDYFQGINAHPANWDPDFMYACIQMENDPKPGGSVRRIYSTGSTIQIGTRATGDCGSLSASSNDNATGAFEFRIPWSSTSGSNQYSTIKVAAFLGWANSKTNPALGIGGGSKDELGPDIASSANIVDNPWVGTPSNTTPVTISDFYLY